MTRLAWLRSLREHITTSSYDSRDSVLCGDFNVTPDLDLGMTGHYTKREQRELAQLCNLGFVDLYRKEHPDLVKSQITRSASIGNVAPADADFGRDTAIIERRQKIKKLTIRIRRLKHQHQAA